MNAVKTKLASLRPGVSALNPSNAKAQRRKDARNGKTFNAQHSTPNSQCRLGSFASLILALMRYQRRAMKLAILANVGKFDYEAGLKWFAEIPAFHDLHAFGKTKVAASANLRVKLGLWIEERLKSGAGLPDLSAPH